MIKSMTAFARCERDTEFGLLSWELKSVNHRFSEVSLRLPDDMKGLEPRVRERLGQVAKRGKVDATLRLQSAHAGAAALAIDVELARQLSHLCREVDALLYSPSPISSLEVLRWPGVLITPERDLAHLGELALELLDAALAEFLATRAREGLALKGMLEERLTGMEREAGRARERVPQVLERLRTRLAERLAELKGSLDQDRVEQEMVIWAQKLDITEELDRLGAHIIEVRRVLAQDDPVGRRLDFLMQELNREANTLGSKSADAGTTLVSVELKVLIEQMREQVQNIE